MNVEMATKTKSVDEVTTVNILTNHSHKREGQKRNLLQHLEMGVAGLLKTPAQGAASQPKASAEELGAEEGSLIEGICSRSEQELQEANRVHKEM